MLIYVDIDDTICYYELEDKDKLDYSKAKPYLNRIARINSSPVAEAKPIKTEVENAKEVFPTSEVKKVIKDIEKKPVVKKSVIS